MIALQNFIQALLMPDLSLSTLADARPVVDHNGMPVTMRTTRFVEAQITWRNERWLLAMPLTPSAIVRMERMVMQQRKFNTQSLAECRILPDEMRWTDAEGHEQHADLILQHLPSGKEFEEALLAENGAALIKALDALQTGLAALNFTHNNLKASNLRWCRGRFVPIRYYDAHIGTDASFENDKAAFDALRRRIREVAPASQETVNDVEATYTPLHTLDGHSWVSHLFEGLVCVEDNGKFGFVDSKNTPVIAPQFIWAGDFHEGRAEVQTEQGMGLIDRTGKFVIEPRYEIVDYDPATSRIYVRENGQWALFDYTGERLTEFDRPAAEVTVWA